MGIFSDFAPIYWEAGLPVIPLIAKDKRPMTGGWQAMQSRMPTEEEMSSWLTNLPNSNIGLPLGPQSGLIACDIDTDDPAIIGVLEKVLPGSPWERVGAKGKVWIYKFDGLPTFRVKIRTPDGLKGIIDMQSTGTQIVMPPSIHPTTGKPYWENRSIVEVLDQVVPLPSNIAQIIVDGLKQIGIEATAGNGGGGVGALTEFVSTGARDNKLVSVAGMYVRDVLKGERTLNEVLQSITAWVEEFTKKVQGDSLDPEKGRQKVIEFLTRDVKAKGKALPKGWDEGLTDEQKTSLGLDYFSEDDERWSYNQIMTEFAGMLEKTGVRENEAEFMTLAEKTLQRVAANRELNGMEEDRLIRHVADVSGKTLTVSSLRKRLGEMKQGPIKGMDHREIAMQVIKDLQELHGEIRSYQERLWRWSGDHWLEMDPRGVIKYIAEEYGMLPAAKRQADHGGVFKTIMSLAHKELVASDVKGINFVNGFLTDDLELRPHNPDFGMTYVLPYPYEAEQRAKCHKWLEMLSAYWGEDEDYAQKVEALREAICVTMFGKATSAQLAYVLYGIAHSGKSRILEIVRALMPVSCSTSIPPTEWASKFSVTQLAGKLLNVAGELSEHQYIDSAKFKEIVDGSEIKGEDKNKPLFMFRPKAAHWFASNHLPKTRDSSEGFTRRFLIFTFNKKFPENLRQEDYDQIVVAEERVAIAAWAVEGMRALKRNNGRVTDPPSSKYQREALENSLNTVRSFLHDLQESGRLLLGVQSTEGATTFDTLWTEYRSYCAMNGVSPVGSKALGKRLEHLQGTFGFRVEKAKNNLGFLTDHYRYLTFAGKKAA